ncbi:hypothetical protein ACOYX0_10730 [Enterococcus thailandicus]|uniref:hypothetical protein n=1 Tax=Enterococcus TaxID=1350 RepID=UPI0012FE3BCB|nr:hypothetical protein [Enterococcus thailandicus]MDT2847307.1 hypothetical protein [Enterococcus thailandicus]
MSERVLLDIEFEEISDIAGFQDFVSMISESCKETGSKLYLSSSRERKIKMQGVQNINDTSLAYEKLLKNAKTIFSNKMYTTYGLQKGQKLVLLDSFKNDFEKDIDNIKISILQSRLLNASYIFLNSQTDLSRVLKKLRLVNAYLPKTILYDSLKKSDILHLLAEKNSKMNKKYDFIIHFGRKSLKELSKKIEYVKKISRSKKALIMIDVTNESILDFFKLNCLKQYDILLNNEKLYIHSKKYSTYRNINVDKFINFDSDNHINIGNLFRESDKFLFLDNVGATNKDILENYDVIVVNNEIERSRCMDIFDKKVIILHDFLNLKFMNKFLRNKESKEMAIKHITSTINGESYIFDREMINENGISERSYLLEPQQDNYNIFSIDYNLNNEDKIISLIKQFSIVNKLYGKTHLYILGGGDKRRIFKEIDSLNLEENVTLYGYVKDFEIIKNYIDMVILLNNMYDQKIPFLKLIQVINNTPTICLENDDDMLNIISSVGGKTADLETLSEVILELIIDKNGIKQFDSEYYNQINYSNFKKIFE